MTIKLKHSGGNSVSLNPPTSAPTSSEVAFKLPNADGSANQGLKTDGSGNLSFGAFGITEADQWAITNSHQFSSTAEVFTANWNRNPCPTYTKIGTGMTESSGVFTFPSTGIYLVMASFRFMSISTTLRYLGFNIQTTTDNFSSTVSADTAYSSIGISTNFGAYAQITNNIMFDVTDTSTHKVRFQGRTETAAGTYLSGTSDGMGSGVTFIRLGGT